MFVCTARYLTFPTADGPSRGGPCRSLHRFALVLLLALSGRAAAEEPGPPAPKAPPAARPADGADGKSAARANPAWQDRMNKALDALESNALSRAVDFAYEAQGIADLPETSAVLAMALFGLALVHDNPTEVYHSITMGERCLYDAEHETAGIEPPKLRSVRLTCLSVLARAYERIANNASAHDRAASCIDLVDKLRHPPATTEEYAEGGRLARDRRYRYCERILKSTEETGFGALGGEFWRYVVVTGQLEYGFRYFLGNLTDPSRRTDGWGFELSLGYPSLKTGSALIRPEIVGRIAFLSEYRTSNVFDAFRTPEDVLAAQVAGLGGRVVVTVPTRLVIVDFGVGVHGSHLQTSNSIDCAPGTPTPDKPCTRVIPVSDWAPELEAVLRWGTPELRERTYTFSFTTFFAVGYTLEWDNPIETIGCTDPDAPKTVVCTDVKRTSQQTVNSLSLRFGLALRFRFGDVKPY